jgi:hypothetical protein
VTAQVFGQWMHFLWGQIACVVLGAMLLRQLTEPLRSRPGLAVFAAWLCTTLPSFEWLGCLAKNDYVIMTFVLAGLLAALNKRFAVAGFFLGFSYATKVLAAWAAIALLWLVPRRKWLAYVVCASAAAAPFLLRNAVFTGNPLFPNLDNVIGPGWISSWWINHNLSFGGGPRFDPSMLTWLSTQMLHKSLPKILLGLGAAAFAYELLKRRAVPQAARWSGMLVTLFVFPLLMLRPGADGRYGNFSASLAALYLVAALLREAFRHPLARRYGWVFFVPLGLLVNTPLDELVKVPKNFLFAPAGKYVESFHPVYDVQKWVNETLRADERILFLAEKQQFYLDRDFETVVEMKKWEEILTPLKSPDALFARLRAMGYDYVHFSPQAGGYPIAIRPYWPAIEALERKAVFRSPTSLVFRLSDLEERQVAGL